MDGMNPRNTITSLIVDYDGVLCSDYFYAPLETSHPEVYERINREFFKGAKDFLRAWMKGQIRESEVHAVFASRFNLPAGLLEQALRAGITASALNAPLLEFIRTFRSEIGKATLLTDNMDVFGRVTVPHFQLDQEFDAIVTSYEEGKLKSDDDCALLDTALERIGGAWETALVLDDWLPFEATVRARGGHFFPFQRGGDPAHVERLVAWWNGET